MTIAPSPIRIMARAKINLALHVTGVRDDGYHLLDSLVTFADIGDELQFLSGDGFELSITGPEGNSLASEDDNLITKAAHLLSDGDAASFGASIELQKYLPVASGIGGGSADAAATLIGLNQLWGLSKTREELSDIGLQLGADVPMCLAGYSLRARGIGETLSPVKLPMFSIVLVNPRVEVSTPKVFSQLHRKDNLALDEFPDADDQASWINWLAAQRNDLQAPACDVAPQVNACLETLRETDALFVRMSGSGATCFGIYANDAAALRGKSYIRDTQAHWWVKSGRTVG